MQNDTEEKRHVSDQMRAYDFFAVLAVAFIGGATEAGGAGGGAATKQLSSSSCLLTNFHRHRS